jgi:Uma2 family endonuclease
MEYITDINKLDLNKMYSYADYLLWQFQERVELIGGKIFKMSPAPTEQHQKISVKLIRCLLDHLTEKPCSLYHAPFDVRLPRKNKHDNKDIIAVVQPDIVVICDPSRIDEKGCLGAPDVVFEILSKSTLQKDLQEKYELYESSGVQEYWIVDPTALTIQVNVRNEEGKYIPGRLLTRGSIAKSSVLQGLVIDINTIFPQIVEEPVIEYQRI